MNKELEAFVAKVNENKKDYAIDLNKMKNLLDARTAGTRNGEIEAYGEGLKEFKEKWGIEYYYRPKSLDSIVEEFQEKQERKDLKTNRAEFDADQDKVSRIVDKVGTERRLFSEEATKNRQEAEKAKAAFYKKWGVSYDYNPDFNFSHYVQEVNNPYSDLYPSESKRFPGVRQPTPEPTIVEKDGRIYNPVTDRHYKGNEK